MPGRRRLARERLEYYLLYLILAYRYLILLGGLGTTSAGLRAGIPALVTPHLVDQFTWGQRIYELGVGSHPIPRPKLTTQGLAEALEELVNNAGLRAAASRLGERIRTENGVRNAVSLIEETYGSW